jgi:hypothetical protein
MSLLDASGCLTEAGVAAVKSATPGRISPEVAAHLAACGRCQERILSGGVPRPPRKPMPDFPSVGRAFLVLALILFAALFFFWTLRQLTG